MIFSISIIAIFISIFMTSKIEKTVESELIKKEQVELIVEKNCKEKEKVYLCEIEALKEQKINEVKKVNKGFVLSNKIH